MESRGPGAQVLLRNPQAQGCLPERPDSRWPQDRVPRPLGPCPLLGEPSRRTGPCVKPQAPVLSGLYPPPGWTQLRFRVRDPTEASDRGCVLLLSPVCIPTPALRRSGLPQPDAVR